jgi:uncharacterized protein with HEPN domain
MPPESAKYLRDMLDAARAIEQYAQDKTLKDFLEQRSVRDATQWNFCVIGEALSQLRRVDEPTAERITDHWKIVGLRNQLIHGYGDMATVSSTTASRGTSSKKSCRS